MMMEAAGGNSLKGVGGNVSECLDFAQRPLTPPEIRKYRRSTSLAPGQRYIHYGTVGDVEKMNLGERTFGAFSERGNNTAADLINHERPSELERMNNLKAERIYRQAAKEPLGRTVDRHIPLPAKFIEGMEKYDADIDVSIVCWASFNTLFPLLF